jgi:hypothetical protein
VGICWHILSSEGEGSFSFDSFPLISHTNFRAPERASDTLLKMSKPMPSGSLIAADSYFGGVQAMEGLAHEGKYCLFSCNQQRPAALFKDYLCKELQGDQDMSTAYGSISLPDGKEMPFMANAFMSQKRKLCTLSTVYSAKKSTTEIQCLVADELIDDQATYHVSEEERPEVRNKYSELMDFVDKLVVLFHFISFPPR